MQNPNPQTVSKETGMDTDVTTWALPEGAIARLGRGRVETLVSSPDGKYLAVGTWIGLWWYELATMKPVDLWETERGMISALEFSPNGALLATGNWDGGVKVWDVQNHRCLAKMQRTGLFDRASELVFSPDGQRLASSGGKYDAIYIWHPETGEQIAKFTVDEELQPRHRPTRIPLAFSPDGKFLIGATPENTFSVWDIETGECAACLTGHSTSVIALLFSPYGEFLSSADYDGGLRKWEVAKLTANKPNPVVASLPETINWAQYIYSSDGILLAATTSGTTVTVLDVERNRKVATLAHKEIVQRIRFSRTGSQLVIVGTDTIQTWNIGDPTPQSPVIRGHTAVCGAVAFSPDGSTLAAGHWINGITLWDVQQLEQQATLGRKELGMIRSLDYSPCGTKLVVGSHDSVVRVWDIEKPEELPTEFTTDQESQWLVAFSPKGDFLVCASSKGGLYVWDGAEKQTQIPVNPGHITSLSISPDGKHIAIAYFDKVAEVWDIRSAKQVADLSVTWTRDTTKYKGDAHQVQRCLEQIKKTPEHSSLPSMQIKGPIVFSPDGATIAGGLFREIRLWDAATHETCMAIRVPQGCQRPEALTFSPCGRYLVSGASWQGTDKMSIRLWEVATGENIVTFWGHPTNVQDLAFSPDGTLLASGSYDGTILLWDMKPYLSPIDPHCPETK